jgi:hypothetical protein
MRTGQWIAGIGALAWTLAACASSDSGSGGAAGSAGSAGDKRTQAATYARDDLSCIQDADCCVVFDSCRAQGYLVAAADKTVVSGLLGSAEDSSCLKCIPPMIQAWCDAGVCRAAKITCTGSLPSEAMQTHCGKMPSLPTDCTTPQDAPGLQPPGLQPQTILGCGS